MLEKKLPVVYLEFKLTGLLGFILLNLPYFNCQGNCLAQSHMAREWLSPDRSDPESRPPAAAKREGQGETGSQALLQKKTSEGPGSLHLTPTSTAASPTASKHLSGLGSSGRLGAGAATKATCPFYRQLSPQGWQAPSPPEPTFCIRPASLLLAAGICS